MKNKGKKLRTDSTLNPFIQLGHKIHTEISQPWYHQSEMEYRNKHSTTIFIIVDIEIVSICDTL